MIRKYINLTTGLEFMPDLKGQEFSFCYLKSSHLEGKHIDKFIESAPDDMLMSLALGSSVEIYDCGSRYHSGCSRVCWQGVPLIKLFCQSLWDIEVDDVFFKNHNSTNIAKGWLQSSKVKSKVIYFKKFYKGEGVNISAVYKKSEHDGEQGFNWCSLL